ncbi:MAG: hypothetical protein SOV20_08770 [Coriobacteriales bacterium]|nr:hypothetical protein [Coriobacteriaceae bacterium]MDY2723890.1 hypothetical protein [Coriobacteriales bacterium]
MDDSAQRPTFERNTGLGTLSDGKAACELASAFFGDPLEWQSYIMDVLLARDKRDKYLHHSLGLAVPRQNGKSWVVRARCFYGAVVDGEKILYTCQHGDTADEMFSSLSAPFEDDEDGDLADLLLAVRKTNGQQAIKLTNGGLIRFTTRTNSLARGKSYDVLIYDEAQELTRAQQAASLPTISASAKKNTQVIYIGTPPGPECNGTVFAHMHDEAHGDQRNGMAWAEWSVDVVPDPHDESAWHRANPSYDTILDVDAICTEADTMDATTFARERLGWWAPAATEQQAIPSDVWRESRINEIARKYQGVRAFGVKFSPDGQRYEVVGCKLKRDKSRGAVERVMSGTTERGTRELAEWLAPRAATASVVVIDGANGPNALCENMRSLGCPKGYVVRPSTSNVMAAAQTFVDSLTDGTCAHVRDKVLDEGAISATKRPIGRQGGWGFGDSICIEAASLALWGARATKRDPSRKQMILR